MSKKLRGLIRRAMERFSPRLVASIICWRSARMAAQKEKTYWDERIADVVACPDNVRLRRHKSAGKIRGGLQTMFNGLRVEVDGYYGRYVSILLQVNKGSHEPQEEVVFEDVLKRLGPGSCMLECGAYWGFYSMWFARDVAQSRVWLIEPEVTNLLVGKRNFEVNNLTGHFTQAFVGRESVAGHPPTVSVDDFLARRELDRLHILHADIQGAEMDMLRGASHALSEHRIDYIFISTHSNDLHSQCACTVNEVDYEVPISVYPEDSYSFDGLLVAHRPGIIRRPLPIPSLKSLRRSSTVGYCPCYPRDYLKILTRLRSR